MSYLQVLLEKFELPLGVLVSVRVAPVVKFSTEHDHVDKVEVEAENKFKSYLFYF